MYTCTNTETRPPQLASVLASISKLFPAYEPFCDSPLKRRVEKTNKRLKCSPDILQGKEKKVGVGSIFLSEIFPRAHDSAISCPH